jgi:hypothetical protein
MTTVVQTPKPNQRRLLAYGTQDQRRFVNDCAFYVAQARAEGPQAELDFRQAFLTRFLELWPDTECRNRPDAESLNDNRDKALCYDLGWAALASADAPPRLHWRAVFQLRAKEWLAEAVS